MKNIIYYSLIFSFLQSCASNSDADNNYVNAIVKERKEKNKRFSNKELSPLPKNEIASFTALNYFPVDEKYNVKARFESVNSDTLYMKTTTARTPMYQKWAKLSFYLQDLEHSLFAYKNLENADDSLLFIPFFDESNGFETYGGGRYLDLNEKQNDSCFLDFNKAYNPYCVYRADFSCPIPPLENALEIKILAGEMNYKSY
jgi:uncharacterized protein (DUF1684 family)